MARRIVRETVVEDGTVVRSHADVHNAEEKARSYSAFDQFVYLIFGIVNMLLLIRFVFRLAGANPVAPIVQFIYELTNIFMAPFRFIFPTNVVAGAAFEWSVLVAIFFYALFAWIITRIIRIVYTADYA